MVFGEDEQQTWLPSRGCKLETLWDVCRDVALVEWRRVGNGNRKGRARGGTMMRSSCDKEKLPLMMMLAAKLLQAGQ